MNDERSPVRPLTLLVGCAAVLGLAARLLLVFRKPLWADEIFTLEIARRPLAELFAALRVDSGPPLHYLLAKLVLLPFPAPGPGDVAVRLLSFAASALHLPLFVRIGRRLGSDSAGLLAVALYSVLPIAVYYGAEGRGYAVASLLALLAFERALALRDEPDLSSALVLGALAAAACLTHYLALFPIAGLAALVPRASRPARRRLALAGGVAAALAALWLPVALAQPRESMVWVVSGPAPEALARFLVDLFLGFDRPVSGSGALVAAAVLVALFSIVRARRAVPVVLRPFALGVGLLVAGALVVRPLLLPERSAVPFLPLTALTIGGAGGAVSAAVAVGALAALATDLPSFTNPLVSEDLAAHLVPAAREGRTICALGLWGPELRFRMARSGLPGQVILFPSDVGRHPGWYDEAGIPDARLREEARALVAAANAPSVYVLPVGLRATAALREELAPFAPRRLVDTPYFEVLLVRGPPGRGGG